MAGRDSGWTHARGPRSPGHVQAARLLLGQLRNSLALGKIQSGAMRRKLQDGTIIEAWVTMGQSGYRIHPVGGGQVKKRNFQLYAYVTASVGDTVGIEVFKLGRYQTDDYDDAPYVEVGHSMERIGQIPFASSADPQGIAFDNEKSTLYVACYGLGGGGRRIAVIEAKGGEHTHVGNITHANPSRFQPFAVAVDEETSTQWSDGAPGDDFGFHVSAWPDEPQTTELPGDPTSGTDSNDLVVAVNEKLRRVYFGFKTQIAVFDADTREFLGYIPSPSDGPAQGMCVSEDGAYIYYTGTNGDTAPEPETEGADMSYFVAQLDAVTGAVLAKIHGADPSRVAVTPNGERLAVVDQANNWVWLYNTAAMPGIPHHTADIIVDTADFQRIRNVQFLRPGLSELGFHHLAWAPDGKRIYCATSRRTTLFHPYQLACLDPDELEISDFAEAGAVDLTLNQIALRLERLDDTFHEE